MDDFKRREWRNRLLGAYRYIVPAILLSAAAWVGWGRLRYDLIRQALAIWPGIAFIGGLAGVVLVQPYAAARSSLLAGGAPLVVAGAACWLVAWEQPVAGIYMSAALTGWAVAANLKTAALRDREANDRPGFNLTATRSHPRR